MVNVCIVGAGVAGLSCASVLHAGGLSVRVLEAGAQAGGRVRSARDAHGRHLGDLGPSWVWPPFQPVLAGWLERLGIATAAQYEHGDGCIESSTEQPPLRGPLPAQHGQHRPVGGPQAIVDALLASLPADAVRTRCPVVAIDRHAARSTVTPDGGETIAADAVVLAAPLRVIVRDITFDPPLPPAVVLACERAPTWMAAQAKALAVYDAPFWREFGLSGRLSSTLGPLVESHDHTGPDGAPAALVGFVGLDAATRERMASARGEDALGAAVLAQLVRCFGERAGHPRLLRIEDWAKESRIATARDIDGPGAHPAVLSSMLRDAAPDAALQFAVAETAERSPGLLEGAFVAGERAAHRLLAAHAHRIHR